MNANVHEIRRRMQIVMLPGRLVGLSTVKNDRLESHGLALSLILSSFIKRNQARMTPASSICAQAAASDPSTSIPRHAASITVTSKPSFRASNAE